MTLKFLFLFFLLFVYVIFSPYFINCKLQATPELEYGRMNIGSRPSKRKPSGGIESLRAIPWIFAWTQTRFHLPVWLGFGAAFKHVIEKDSKNLQMLRDMYNQWPFFRVTLDLVEMVFAKGDPGIATLYDKLLVSDELWSFGERLRSAYEETKSLLLMVNYYFIAAIFLRDFFYRIFIWLLYMDAVLFYFIHHWFVIYCHVTM
jgi:phosphoenolpyruvate carboxylase